MKLGRSIRSVVAILALLGVLLGQLGIAAHACPMMAGGEDCCMTMDAGDAALCGAHCQQGDQSLDKPPVPEPGLAFALQRVIPPLPAISPPPDPPSLLARATAPSAAVRHCRFQI